MTGVQTCALPISAEYDGAFASDLMSDVLCYLRETTDNQLLITGLSNMQIIHTATTLDITTILIVRGKPIDENLISGAKKFGVNLFKTDLAMFEACGVLYQAGFHQ